jgi:hypothetical protein
MRDFAKSMVSYSWATSVFGMSQVVNLFRPSQAVKAFDNVTHATAGELDDIFKATFTVGDNLQRRLVDLGFSVFTLGGALNPGNVTKAAAGAPSPVAAPGGTPGWNPQSTGWGPVPPPPSSSA